LLAGLPHAHVELVGALPAFFPRQDIPHVRCSRFLDSKSAPQTSQVWW